MKKEKAFPICLDHANSFGNFLSKTLFTLVKKRGPEHCFCRFLKNTVPSEFLLLKLYIFYIHYLISFQVMTKSIFTKRFFFVCVCVCVCVFMYFLLFKTIKNYKTMIRITTITGKSIKNTIKQQVTILNIHVQGKQVSKNEIRLQRTIS